jgi:hypothetical protein
MADVHRFSERVIELAERTSAVADAAQGRRVRRGGARMRWLLLPAAGAGLYALVTNGSFTRQAKSAMTQVKERASDLPEELVERAQEATGQTKNQRKAAGSRSGTAPSRSRSRKTASAR